MGGSDVYLEVDVSRIKEEEEERVCSELALVASI